MKPTSSEERLTLVFIYSGEYTERVIRNLINDPSFCKSCGLYCNYANIACTAMFATFGRQYSCQTRPNCQPL